MEVRTDHESVSVTLYRTEMDLAENTTELYIYTKKFETKSREVLDKTGECDSEREKVAELENCLRNTSGTAAEMT